MTSLLLGYKFSSVILLFLNINLSYLWTDSIEIQALIESDTIFHTKNKITFMILFNNEHRVTYLHVGNVCCEILICLSKTWVNQYNKIKFMFCLATMCICPLVRQPMISSWRSISVLDMVIKYDGVILDSGPVSNTSELILCYPAATPFPAFPDTEHSFWKWRANHWYNSWNKKWSFLFKFERCINFIQRECQLLSIMNELTELFSERKIKAEIWPFKGNILFELNYHFRSPETEVWYIIGPFLVCFRVFCVFCNCKPEAIKGSHGGSVQQHFL